MPASHWLCLCFYSQMTFYLIDLIAELVKVAASVALQNLLMGRCHVADMCSLTDSKNKYKKRRSIVMTAIAAALSTTYLEAAVQQGTRYLLPMAVTFFDILPGTARYELRHEVQALRLSAHNVSRSCRVFYQQPAVPWAFWWAQQSLRHSHLVRLGGLAGLAGDLQVWLLHVLLALSQDYSILGCSSR